jgi:oligopeptide transport system substrate-binding protein
MEVQTFSDSASQRAAVAIQSMWLRELGVHITITPLEQKTLFQNQQSLNYTIGLSGWMADYADPYTFLQTCVTGNGNNWCGWSNPGFDRLLDEASRTVDNTRRYALFQQAEAILLHAAPLAPLTYGRTYCAVDPAVHGWHPNKLGFQLYKDVWLGDAPSPPGP